MRWAAAALTAAGPTRAQPPRRLGGRCQLAAVLLKVLSLLIVIEPATWLILGLIDSLQTLSGRLDPAVLVLPPPPSTAKSWPLIGETLHEFWELASTNLRPALTRIAPQLKSLGSALLQIGREPGPARSNSSSPSSSPGFSIRRRSHWPMPQLACRVASECGEEFVRLAGATIRVVSRGVIGISVLQAFLAGLGVLVAGVPGAQPDDLRHPILGIIQVGPAVVLLPLIVWS